MASCSSHPGSFSSWDQLTDQTADAQPAIFEANASHIPVPTILDTEDPQTRVVWEANLEAANTYQTRCKAPRGGTALAALPRVLIVGYGNWSESSDNISGRIVETLVGTAYPEAFDPSHPEASVKQQTISIARPASAPLGPYLTGDQALACGMILPVAWDLAAIMAIREIAAFRPHVIILGGVANYASRVGLELGATNEALSADATGLSPEQRFIVPNARAEDQARGSLFFWSQALQEMREGLSELSAPIGMADLISYPRSSNTYLCNNITYLVGYAMDHPREKVLLLQPSHDPLLGIQIGLRTSLAKVPRIFIHWPSAFDGHAEMGAELLRRVIFSQLEELAEGNAAIRGTPEMATAQEL